MPILVLFLTSHRHLVTHIFQPTPSHTSQHIGSPFRSRLGFTSHEPVGRRSAVATLRGPACSSPRSRHTVVVDRAEERTAAGRPESGYIDLLHQLRLHRRMGPLIEVALVAGLCGCPRRSVDGSYPFRDDGAVG